MTSTADAVDRPWVVLRPVAYLAALLVGANEVLQAAIMVGPFEPAAPTWRFRTALITAARVAPLVVALLTALIAAQATRSRAALRVVGWIAAFLGLAFLVVAITLWVDGPSAKLIVEAADLARFVRRWFQGLGEALLGGLMMTVLAGVAGRLSR